MTSPQTALFRYNKLIIIYCCSLSIPGSLGLYDPTYFSTPVNCKHLQSKKDDSDEELMLVRVCFLTDAPIQHRMLLDTVINKIMHQLIVSLPLK